MSKTKPTPRKPDTHFTQVPVTVVKKLVGGTAAKPAVPAQKNVVTGRKFEPSTTLLTSWSHASDEPFPR